MQVAASIFKAYDIRGVTPTDLNEGVAEALPKPRFESNAELHRAVVEGIQGLKAKLAAAY